MTQEDVLNHEALDEDEACYAYGEDGALLPQDSAKRRSDLIEKGNLPENEADECVALELQKIHSLTAEQRARMQELSQKAWSHLIKHEMP